MGIKNLLVVVDSSDERMPPLIPEEVALAAGRPILVTPFSWTPSRIGRRVLVAWNARREAARAVSDALPILCKAEWVSVLVVNPEKWAISPHGEEPGADIALYLARHGVKVQVEVAESEAAKVGEVIRARAHKAGAELVVMGAYGHSRTLELILGGVTRDMLCEMTVPVFVSH
jgi:nucleotide-binding universal stress UspA family protein